MNDFGYLDRIKYHGTTDSDVKKYNCDRCKDSGMVGIHLVTGEEAALRDFGLKIPGSYQSDYKFHKCSCDSASKEQVLMRDSGIVVEEFKTKTMQAFKTKDEASQAMKDVATKFLADSKALGMGMFGKSGTGKTHICVAVCNELIKKGINVRYLNYRPCMQKLKTLDYKPMEREIELGKYKNAKVLYIDDLFKLVLNNNGEADTAELRIMYEIINYRYANKLKTIVSSEYTATEISKKIDEAIGGRLIEMIGIYGYHTQGPNKRVDKLREQIKLNS